MSRIERWFPGTSVGNWTSGQFGGGESPPGAPGTLSLAAGASTGTVIDLSWSTGLTGTTLVTGYHIQISTDGASWSDRVADTGTTATTYSATGLTGGTQYWFRVAAINSVGDGVYGNEPSRTTGAALAYTTTGSPTTRTYTSGGTSYKSLHWTGSGSLVVSAGGSSQPFDMWVVAGGGAGGGGTHAANIWGGSGGGGAGGAKAFTGQSLSDATHTVTVGAGGAATIGNVRGNTGGLSSFAISGGSTLSTSGGGGGAYYNTAGVAGGSGGGGGGYQAGWSGGAGTAGEGNAGGTGSNETSEPINGAGGGGLGGVGADGPSNTIYGGAGGTYGTNDYADGTTSGVGVGQWAGGGGGGSQVGGASGGGGAGAGGSSAVGANATANSGSGGGGSGNNGYSGAGGSGAVVIRWAV